MRAARERAPRSPPTCSSAALADRLRIDGTAQRPQAQPARPPAGRAHRRRSSSELELIRSSPLFDAAWYLRHYHDVVRSGEEPGLHFLRHPTRPIRAPGPDFDTARYLDDHPEVLERGRQPAGPLPAVRGRAGRRPLPARSLSMPDLETGRRRCADFQQRWRAFVRALAARRPRGPGPRPRASSSGRWPTGLPEPEQPQKRPDRGALLRCAMAVVRESGAFDEEGYVEANRLATRRTDPLLHFVDEGWRDLRAPSLDFDLWWYCVQLPRPDGRGRQPAAPLPARRAARGPRSRSPVRRPHALPTQLRRRATARAAPACSRPTTATGWSTTTWSTTCASWPGTPTSSTSPTGCSSPASSTSSRASPGGLERPARGVRLRLLVAAGPRPGRLGAARRLRRGHARQRQLLPGPAARRRVRRDGPPRLRLVEPAGDVDGVQRGRRRRRRLDAARRGAKRELVGPRRWADVRLPPPQLLLPGAAAAGARRRGLPVPARHRLRTAHQAARRRQVRDRHQPLPDGRRLRVRHLGRRAVPVPPVVLAALLRPDRARASRWSSATSSPRTRATSRASPPGRSGCAPRRPRRRST